MSRLSPEYQHHYPSLAVCPWIRVIMDRDGHRCLDCGRDQGLVVSRIWWITLCRPCHARRLGTPRNGAVARKLREKGYTLAKIAELLGVSRQRIHQLCQQLPIDNVK